MSGQQQLSMTGGGDDKPKPKQPRKHSSKDYNLITSLELQGAHLMMRTWDRDHREVYKEWIVKWEPDEAKRLSKKHKGASTGWKGGASTLGGHTKLELTVGQIQVSRVELNLRTVPARWRRRLL